TPCTGSSSDALSNDEGPRVGPLSVVAFGPVPGRRRRRQVEMERVLGTPALFATAYGHVGSSIYYALRLTAVYALGLPPLAIVVLVALNIVGVQEAAKVSVSLAVIDFATQVLLVVIGFALVFSPHVLRSNVHWGVAPTWGNLAISIPVAMLAYTGVETVSNLAEEARDPVRTVPAAYKLVAGAVFAIYFTLPLVALS